MATQYVRTQTDFYSSGSRFQKSFPVIRRLQFFIARSLLTQVDASCSVCLPIVPEPAAVLNLAHLPAGRLTFFVVMGADYSAYFCVVEWVVSVDGLE